MKGKQKTKAKKQNKINEYIKKNTKNKWQKFKTPVKQSARIDNKNKTIEREREKEEKEREREREREKDEKMLPGSPDPTSSL